jgi:hypothetical protein
MPQCSNAIIACLSAADAVPLPRHPLFLRVLVLMREKSADND